MLVCESPDPNYNKLAESKEWEVATQPPAPLFPLHPNTYDANVAKVIDEIFTEMEAALPAYELFAYGPSAEKIAIIKKYMKVDAFLFLRVRGNRYTDTRKGCACIANMGILAAAVFGGGGGSLLTLIIL